MHSALDSSRCIEQDRHVMSSRGVDSSRCTLSPGQEWSVDGVGGSTSDVPRNSRSDVPWWQTREVVERCAAEFYPSGTPGEIAWLPFCPPVEPLYYCPASVGHLYEPNRPTVFKNGESAPQHYHAGGPADHWAGFSNYGGGVESGVGGQTNFFCCDLFYHTRRTHYSFSQVVIKWGGCG